MGQYCLLHRLMKRIKLSTNQAFSSGYIYIYACLYYTKPVCCYFVLMRDNIKLSLEQIITFVFAKNTVDVTLSNYAT